MRRGAGWVIGRRLLVSPSGARRTTTSTSETIHLRLRPSRGAVVEVEAPVGLTLMEAIRDVARMDMEAACDGTCACSTCHVILSPASYDAVPDRPSEDEMDMLDLAPSVTSTSRLSCQVRLTSAMEGLEATIPDEMENQMHP